MPKVNNPKPSKVVIREKLVYQTRIKKVPVVKYKYIPSLIAKQAEISIFLNIVLMIIICVGIFFYFL